jgi:hypothetical protein
MNTNENLHGTLVLVDPQLRDDPLKGQGQIAFIKYASQQRDEIYVGFLDGKEAFYQPAELMRLKNRDQLFDDLNNGAFLSFNDFKALYKVATLLDRGTNMAHVQALEVARDNPPIWEKALEHLPVQQKQELAHHFSR